MGSAGRQGRRTQLADGQAQQLALGAGDAFEKYTQAGVLALGAYIAMTSNNPLSLGGLIGFMMLGGRVAGPLVNLARLLQDIQEARQALFQVGWVLNRPTEKRALTYGLRPKFEGAISFEDVTFKYEGSKTPALDRISFSIEPGIMLGLVAARALANPLSPAC